MAELAPAGGTEPGVVNGRGVVAGLYVAARAAEPMRSVSRARVLAGQGFAGDRYATGKGTWSYEERYRNDVTLVEQEVLERVVDELGLEVADGWSRRNVVTTGIRLGDLIGHRFRIGPVELWGERPCDPCAHLDRLTGRAVRRALRGRGGLRAHALTGGVVEVGQVICPIAS